jgi:hypothetical protein
MFHLLIGLIMAIAGTAEAAHKTIEYGKFSKNCFEYSKYWDDQARLQRRRF